MASTMLRAWPCPESITTGTSGRRCLRAPSVVEPVHAGQHHVERDEIRLGLVERGERLLPVRDREDLVALARDQGLHVVAYARIVVDHEHAKAVRHASSLLVGFHSMRGSVRLRGVSLPIEGKPGPAKASSLPAQVRRNLRTSPEAVRIRSV